MNAALAEAVEPLATRVSLDELEQRMRTHFDIATESLRDDIRLIATGMVNLTLRMDDLRGELKSDIAGLDRRLMRVEAEQAKHCDQARLDFLRGAGLQLQGKAEVLPHYKISGARRPAGKALVSSGSRRAHARPAARSGASGPRERPRGVRGAAPSRNRRCNAARRDAPPGNLATVPHS
ncbi:MAG: hypothetical protein QF681_08710 [Vicinamibacterales bacterium]|jgi:hypothetical protein|nr:hypothetical protein [Vicinamibacterales bacterium]